MSKRLSLVLVALLIVPLVLSACSTASRDVAEDYVNSVLDGDAEAAQELACDSFVEQTQALAAEFGSQNVHGKDLKFDIGKGNNEEEIIVTGSYLVGPEDDADEVELAASVRVRSAEESVDTRFVLWMQEEGDDWCVSDESTFGYAGEEAPVDDAESEDAATEEPAADAEATEAAE